MPLVFLIRPFLIIGYCVYGKQRCLSGLELFHCLPLGTTVRLHGKKATKCNKLNNYFISLKTALSGDFFCLAHLVLGLAQAIGHSELGKQRILLVSLISYTNQIYYAIYCKFRVPKYVHTNQQLSACKFTATCQEKATNEIY